MTIMGQLQPGVVQVVKPGTDTVIGYAFTVEDGKGGQIQRWLLHENPHNALEIRPAPATMSGWTLSDWKAGVSRLWKEGSYYVRAQADVYVHGGNYHGTTWTQIPPASALPNATYPDVNGANLQLEYGCGGDALRVQQGGVEGLVFTMGRLSDASSVEYWMLPASYEAAGRSSSWASAVTASATSALGTCSGATAGAGTPAELQQFIDLANQSWSSGSRFVITGCVNYHGTNAPAAP